MAVIAVVALAAGCGGQETPAADDESPASDDTDGTDDTAASFEGEVLRVALWGGSWTDGVDAGVTKEFEEQTGATVEYIQGNPADYSPQLIAADGENVPFDLVYTDGITQTDLVERGLLEPLDEEAVPTASEISSSFPPVNPGYSPGVAIWYIGVAYNMDKFEELGLDAPTSWDVLWQPELAGHVALPDISTSMGLPTLLSASARATDGDLTALEEGVEELSQIDTYSVYSSSADMQNDFAAGDVWVASAADGRAWQLNEDGQPISFVVPEIPGTDKSGWADLVYLDVVAGTEKRELADIFQGLAHEAEAQKAITRETAYSPILSGAVEDMYAEDDKWKQRLPEASQWSSFAVVDWSEMKDRVPEAVDLFSRGMS